MNSPGLRNPLRRGTEMCGQCLHGGSLHSAQACIFHANKLPLARGAERCAAHGEVCVDTAVAQRSGMHLSRLRGSPDGGTQTRGARPKFAQVTLTRVRLSYGARERGFAWQTSGAHGAAPRTASGRAGTAVPGGRSAVFGQQTPPLARGARGCEAAFARGKFARGKVAQVKPHAPRASCTRPAPRPLPLSRPRARAPPTPPPRAPRAPRPAPSPLKGPRPPPRFLPRGPPPLSPRCSGPWYAPRGGGGGARGSGREAPGRVARPACRQRGRDRFPAGWGTRELRFPAGCGRRRPGAA